MSAITFDLTGEYRIEQGADYRLAFALFDQLPDAVSTGDGTIYTGGVLTDLTGLRFQSQFRATDAMGAVQATAPNNLFSVEDSGGIRWVVMHLPHTMTSAIQARRGVYNIEVVDPVADEIIRLIEGEWEMSPDATRPEEP